MIIKWITVITSVFLGWIFVMALVMRFSNAAPAAVVFFPPNDFMKLVPEDTVLLSYTDITLTLSSNSKAFGEALYHAGAWLVLPAGLKGCLPI